MAALLDPSVRLPPLTTSGACLSPLSICCLRPRTLPLPQVHCCAHRTAHPRTARREAAAAVSWPEKLAGVVPWKVTVSAALALASSFSFCKLSCPFRRLLSFAMLQGTDLSEVCRRIRVRNCYTICYLSQCRFFS